MFIAPTTKEKLMSKEQTIIIGKFSFGYHLCSDKQVYITHDSGDSEGEGRTFSVEEFEKVVEKFYNERF